MAFNPMAELDSSNPIYPFMLLFEYRILVSQKCQHTCLAIEVARSYINREKLGGLTPIAVCIKRFDKNKVLCLIRWAGNDLNRLLGPM
jgi:hypothetical protein